MHLQGEFMMEENIKKILDQIREHIINCAFKDKSIFIRNIKVMKFNTELEWFNCALIAMDCRPSNRFIVNTLVLRQEKGLIK